LGETKKGERREERREEMVVVGGELASDGGRLKRTFFVLKDADFRILVF